METLRRHGSLALVLALFVALGLAYSIVNPLFESPDEDRHYEYVRWLVEGHGLPRPEEVGTAPWQQEGSQPPLYYLLVSAITRPIPTDNSAQVLRYNPHMAMGQPASVGNKNLIVHGTSDAWPWQGVALAAHVARFVSLLLGLLTVISAYGTAHTLFRAQPAVDALAALAAAIVAFNPQFLFISASVNNDSLVVAACAAGVWAIVCALSHRDDVTEVSGDQASAGGSSEPTRQGRPTFWQWATLGLLAGIAALSKLNGLLLAGLAALAVLAVAWRRRSIAEFVRGGLIVGTGALLVAGWWYGRNFLLYGDPLGLRAMFDVLPQRAAPPTLAELTGRAEGVWRSFWAVFGWFNVPADEWLYAIYTSLTAASLIGLVVGWVLRRAGRRRPSAQDCSVRGIDPVPLALLVLWIGMVVAGLIAWAQMRYPQGRLLFPGLTAAAVLGSYGLLNWMPQRIRGAAAAFVATGLSALAVSCLWLWIAPAYAAPPVPPQDAALPNPLSVRFGDEIQLLGYELTDDSVHPGETLAVAFYWRCSQRLHDNYSVFIHLVDEDGILQAQCDSYPGAGNLATSEWPAETTLRDVHTVEIPATARAPSSLRVDIGLYDFATGRRLSVREDTVRQDGDSWTLGHLALLPLRGADGVPNPVFINFDDQIALVGFELDRHTLRAGETLGLALWWKTLRSPRLDYVVFVHLVYPPDAVWAQEDAMPVGDTARTSSWTVGQRVEDRHALTLPLDAPSGEYAVEIGLYDPATLDRLAVDLSDKGIVVGQVRVTAE